MRAATSGLLAAPVMIIMVIMVSFASVVYAVPEKKREPTFKPGGHIHGYLIDPAGKGLTGVVALSTVDGGRISYHHTESFRRGRFDIDNLFPDTYRLHVESLGALQSDLEPPDDVTVEVRAKKVSRPRLVAVTRGSRGTSRSR